MVSFWEKSSSVQVNTFGFHKAPCPANLESINPVFIWPPGTVYVNTINSVGTSNGALPSSSRLKSLLKL